MQMYRFDLLELSYSKKNCMFMLQLRQRYHQYQAGGDQLQLLHVITTFLSLLLAVSLNQ